MGRRRRQQVVSSMIGFADIGLAAFFQLVLIGLTSRLLGEAGLGRWQALFQVFSLAQLIDLGQTQGIVRILGDRHGTAEWPEALASAAMVQWAIGLAACMGCLLGALFLPGYLGLPPWDEVAVALLLLGVWSTLRFRGNLVAVAAYAGEHLALSSTSDLCISVGRPLVACAAMLIHPTLLTIPVTYILVEMVVQGLVTLIGRRVVCETAPGRAAWATVRRIVSFGIGNGLVSAAGQTGTYLLPIIIGSQLGLGQLTAYTCGITLPILAFRLGTVAVRVVYPSMIVWKKDGGRGVLPPSILRHLPALLALLIVGGIALAFVYEPFIRLWVGPGYLRGGSFRWGLGAASVTWVVAFAVLTLARVHYADFRWIGIAAVLQVLLTILPAPWIATSTGVAGILWWAVAVHWGWVLVTVLAIRQAIAGHTSGDKTDDKRAGR